mgnify:CR=1 FL=1
MGSSKQSAVRLGRKVVESDSKSQKATSGQFENLRNTDVKKLNTNEAKRACSDTEDIAITEASLTGSARKKPQTDDGALGRTQ